MSEDKQTGFFQNKSRMLGTALVLILASFFLINLGLRDVAWAYWLGLIALAAGMLLPPLSRFTAGGKGKDEQDGSGKDG